MTDLHPPALVPSPLKIALLFAAFALMAVGVCLTCDGSPLKGGLTAYGGVLIIFGCYAHGNGERNRLRSLEREHRRS